MTLYQNIITFLSSEPLHNSQMLQGKPIFALHQASLHLLRPGALGYLELAF